MKICFSILSDGWGGAETVVYELVSRLAKKNYKVILLLNNEIFDHYKNIKGIEFINIGNIYNHNFLIKNIIFSINNNHPRSDNDKGFWYVIDEFLRLLYYVKIRKTLNLELARYDIDFIHSNLENADILTGLFINKAVNKISTIHGLHIPHLNIKNNENIISSVLNKLKSLLLIKAINRFNNIIFVSDYTKNQFKKFMRIPESSVVINNGIDLNLLTKSKMFKDESRNSFTLIFPGGNKTGKGNLILLEAVGLIIGSIPNIQVLIAGADSPTPTISLLIERLNLKSSVSYVGKLPRDKYLYLLSTMDIFCLPSADEAFPLSIMEAMAIGIPVIATNIGGIPDLVIDRRNGLLVNQDANEVAQAISTIYIDNELRKKLIENGKKDVIMYDWTVVLDKYLSFYEEITPSSI